MAAIGYDGLTVGMTSDEVVNDLYLTYLAEENSTELLAEIGPLTEEMINSMRYSMNGMGIAEGIFYQDLTVTAEVVDSEGNVIGSVKAGRVAQIQVGINQMVQSIIRQIMVLCQEQKSI